MISTHYCSTCGGVVTDSNPHCTMLVKDMLSTPLDTTAAAMPAPVPKGGEFTESRVGDVWREHLDWWFDWTTLPVVVRDGIVRFARALRREAP